MRARHRWSIAAYRLLLRAYPPECRARFAEDLRHDFLQMLADRGRPAAWRRITLDLIRSVPAARRSAGPPPRGAPAVPYKGGTVFG